MTESSVTQYEMHYEDALLDRPEATLTHHLKTITRTRPRRVLVAAVLLWAIPHLDLHNLKIKEGTSS